jgi:hypothetical protein
MTQLLAALKKVVGGFKGESIAKEIMGLSSGTMANITKVADYKKIEKIQDLWAEFAATSGKTYGDWVEAWAHFTEEHGLKKDSKGNTTEQEIDTKLNL